MSNISFKKLKTIKFIAILLCFVLLLAVVSTASVVAVASNDFDEKLQEVKKLYPEGSQKYEWAVNGSVVGWQCHGYARWISFYVWGVDFANGSGKNWVRYDSTATTTAIDKLAPGDVLRYRTSASKNSNHSIFVTKIVEDIVYFTDCNSDGANTIKWDRSITKEKLASLLKLQLAGRDYVEYGYIAHYTPNTLTATNSVNISYNVNGGTFASSGETVTKYTVVESDGLNVRSGAGTEYGIVTALPKGTVFTVTQTAKDKAGKYTWGKTTYNGKTGWCVISMHWTTAETISTAPYSVDSSGNIISNVSGSKYIQTMLYGSEYKNGFTKAEDFGIFKKDNTFVGWSKTKNGSIIPNSLGAIKPESIFPELKDGNLNVTLYAVWQSNVVLNSIEVETLPAKTKYLLKAPFDSNGLKIKLNYSNNTSKTITDGFTLNGFDSATAGEKTITVTYLGKTTTFKVLVEDLKTGDLNGDLNINLADIIILAQYAAGWELECNETALDVNDDGVVNLADLTHLSRYVAGWDGIDIK